MKTDTVKRFPKYPPVVPMIELSPRIDRDEFCERAAIREYDGKMSRKDAEIAAKFDIECRMTMALIEAQPTNLFIDIPLSNSQL